MGGNRTIHEVRGGVSPLGADAGQLRNAEMAVWRI